MTQDQPLQPQLQFPTLPAVIPPTTRLNFIRNWWNRSEHTSAIAEARLLHRAHITLPSNAAISHPIPLIGRLLKVPLDALSDQTNENGAKTRLVNTLYLRADQRDPPLPQQPPFTLDDKPGDLESIKNEIDDSKNLVICHGYGAGLGLFYRNYFTLGQKPGWRIFAIDWLGMGRSSRPKWSIVKKSKESWDDIVERTEDHFVESLEQWRSQVGIEKMTLCGHSMGGYFATCYALKYPDRVRKLILVSPAGIPERPPELGPDPREAPGASPKELLTKEASELAAANDTATMSAEAIAQSNGDPQVLPSPPVRKIPAWAKYLWDKNITPMSIVRFSGPFGASLVNNYASKRFAHLNVDERHDLYDYLYQITSSTGSGEYALAAILTPGAYARKPLIHRMAKLQMPTVFIYGDNDWMDYKAAEKASENMKVPTKVIRVSDGGHHMYLDNPDEFNQYMLKEMDA